MNARQPSSGDVTPAGQALFQQHRHRHHQHARATHPENRPRTLRTPAMLVSSRPGVGPPTIRRLRSVRGGRRRRPQEMSTSGSSPLRRP